MDKETHEFLANKFDAIDEKFSRIDENFEETKRHFGVIAEGLRNDVRQVAEGHEVVRQEIQVFRNEAKEEFKEVKSMIKFSYAELD